MLSLKKIRKLLLKVAEFCGFIKEISAETMRKSDRRALTRLCLYFKKIVEIVKFSRFTVDFTKFIKQNSLLSSEHTSSETLRFLIEISQFLALITEPVEFRTTVS